MFGRDVEVGSLSEERSHVVGAKRVAASCEQGVARTFRNEHADAPSLVQDSVIYQHIHSLERRRRIDPVKRGELVDRWHLRLLGHGSVDDLSFDLFRDLDKDGATIVHGDLQVHWLIGDVTNQPARSGFVNPGTIPAARWPYSWSHVRCT